MRRFLLLLAIPFLLVPTGVASAASQRVEEGDGSLSARVESSLARHVQGEEIAAWHATLAPGSLERDAADWILAWLPLADLAALDLTLLQEHVIVAAQSYRESPWRDELPRELWLHFVVPHRVSQEPAQAWRRRFRAELLPRIDGAPDMDRAALAVNRWCREQATFISTSGRDLGPLTTMARGLGRCEEEMILTISALRAAGIPARRCAPPYWAHTDNNHAWVEAWADGRWYYIGGCEPGRCLNDAWFTNPARRAGFVRSVGYGEFDPAGEELYRAEKGSTIINSTSVYTDPFTLAVALYGGEADAPQIHVNVVNFGSLRPIARFDAGGEIALGPGEYAVTADLAGELLLSVVRGRPGERVEIALSEADRYDLEASPGFWLRYPEGEQAPRRDLELVSEEDRTLLNLRVRAREGDREKLRVPSTSELAALDSLNAGDRARVEEICTKPLERVSTIFLLLDCYRSAESREALLAFLERADDKDLLELNEIAIRSHVDAALAVRGRLDSIGLAVPDSLFADHVLACRIEREPGGAWRDGLPLIDLAEDAEASLAALLAAFRARMRPTESGFFGPPLDPAQSWRLGLGSDRDLGIALAGLLRRNGFPGRYRHGRCEVWLGQWRELDPLPDEGAEEEDASRTGPGRLAIEITRGGLPYEQAESYRHFMVSRPADGYLESPWWDPLPGEQDWDAGDYLLCSAMRVPGGSVYARLRGFTVRPGELTRVSLPVDVDPAGWDPGDALLAGGSSDSLLARLAAAAPVDADGAALPTDGFFLLFAPGEPATRMLSALGEARARLEGRGIPLLPVLVGPAEAEPWTARLADAGFSPRLWRDTASSLDTDGEGGSFEPIVMLRSEGKTVLLRRGFDSAVGASAHLALDLMD